MFLKHFDISAINHWRSAKQIITNGGLWLKDRFLISWTGKSQCQEQFKELFVRQKSQLSRQLLHCPRETPVWTCLWRTLSPARSIPCEFASVVMEIFPALIWASLCAPWGDLQHEAERTAFNGICYFVNSESKAGSGCDQLTSCE